MSIERQDVYALSDLVRQERGDKAAHYVSQRVDLYRREGDRQNALLWSMVLANIYHNDIMHGAIPRVPENL